MLKIIQSLGLSYIVPESIDNIPNEKYLVYILCFNDKPIVLGHGRKNRARVIFDDLNHITSGHIKAMVVRLYHIFTDGEFSRLIIPCNSKQEAQDIEKQLHNLVGGNTLELPKIIIQKLFDGLELNSNTYLILRIALSSSFDGLSDLRKWNRLGLIDEEVWEELSTRLRLTSS
jgi:hypothetical protein